LPKSLLDARPRLVEPSRVLVREHCDCLVDLRLPAVHHQLAFPKGRLEFPVADHQEARRAEEAFRTVVDAGHVVVGLQGVRGVQGVQDILEEASSMAEVHRILEADSHVGLAEDIHVEAADPILVVDALPKEVEDDAQVACLYLGGQIFALFPWSEIGEVNAF